MTVTDFMIGRKSLLVNDLLKLLGSNNSTTDSDVTYSSVVELAEISGICNEGEFDASTYNLPPEQRKVFGNVTDQAILRFAEKIHPVSDARSEWKSLYRVPFNSKNKFMINVIQRAAIEKDSPIKSDLILTIKGAPDIILAKCTHYASGNGVTEPLTDDQRKFIEGVKDTWSKQAKRVILMARKNLGQKLSSLDNDSIEFEDGVMRQSNSGLEVVGLVAIVDPIRDEIPEVIRILRGASVKVHMVTGDFKLTAQAIAIECGIISQPVDLVDDVSALSRASAEEKNVSLPRSIVLSGPDMMLLDDEQWDVLCNYDEIVFARTTPEQKLRIVKELQRRGEVVGSKSAPFHFS
jgi:sodium/potassium-transporting ATPase subunit alpha